MYLRYGDLSWDVPESQNGLSAGSASRGPVENNSLHARRDDGSQCDHAGLRLPTIDLHGVRLHAVTEVATVRHVLNSLDAGCGGTVVTPNLDHLRRCGKDVNFAALVAEAELVVADGMPLVWASRLQRTPLPERVAGSNLISSLTEGAAVRGRSVFLLGGAPGTAEGAAEVLCKRFPGLKVAGTYCPPVGFERNTRVMGELHNLLTASKADIVYVALGSPKQERLIARLKPLLPGAWWLGVGNSFSFLCGHVRRAPMWMQNWGLEWVHRLSQEPRRLFKRYLVVGLPFGAALLGRAATVGVANRFAGRAKATAAATAGAAATGASLPVELPAAVASPAASATSLLASDVTLRLVPSDGPIGTGQSGPTAPTGREPSVRIRVVPSERASQGDESVEAGGATRPVRAASRLPRLRALVLLGGSVRPSALATAAERSVLDLPLDENGSVLNYWLSQAKEVARSAGLDSLPVRVMVNQASPEPYSADERFFGTFRVERDRSEYRGTAGVLYDLAAEYGDEDMILVANAAQVLLEPLPAIAAALEARGGDVSVISHEDGTPSGVMLLTCKTLRAVPDTGYVDMKEQALPKIASRFDVRVLQRRRPTGLPIRTLEDYVQGLRFHHRHRAGKPVVSDPLAEDWGPAFSLSEGGAVVGAGARVHDSVVLAGGVVEPGAVVVRCVVCPGGVVRRDRTAVDQFITLAGRSRAARGEGPEKPGKSDSRGGVGGSRPMSMAPPLPTAPVVAPAAIQMGALPTFR